MTIARTGSTLGLLVLLFGAALGCKGNVLRHDPTVAAKEAERFATLAVIDRAFSSAHGMLAEASKKQVSESMMLDVVGREHPHGYPAAVHATEFEPVPGQAAIQIFLRGDSATEQFFYRVPMLGTADAGYKPGGIMRGSGPYPPSPLRKTLP
jgi:hypothetical protein